MTRVADVTALLEADSPGVGLVCGEGDAPVRHVLLAVDAVPATGAEAGRLDADMLVTLGGTVTAELGYRLGAAGTALCVVPSTDRDECSEAVAGRLGVVDAAPLTPRDEALDTVVAFVPKPDVERVIDALAEAGAGAIGDYARCVWTAEGVGSFVPLDGARPVIGAVGEVESVAETRVEMVLPRARRAEVAAALLRAHPYEEPAFYLCELAARPGRDGLGRVGDLASPVPLSRFAAQVARRLGGRPGGVRVAGDPDRPVQRVAVVAEAAAAGDLLRLTADADVLVTDELPASVVGAGPAVVCAGTWATRRPRLDAVAARLGPLVRVTVSDVVTDPWSLHV
ncbi:Nif3-like dinuclear metal center hexameric protein [Actinomadura oligospora]|uniref:Nif3-like dinuclear metal center hexameric protein n=1 Tax=Actinomadura oligospora TaxID=111804 RepID=UPI0004AF833E|nr:Nif3-like dinuclear metal center hexameric protein [Actinomadura oligospora]